MSFSHARFMFDPQGGQSSRPADRFGGHQKSNRSANCISRGVPEPTGVIGETMLVFTVLMMLPNPVVFDALKVDCGWPSCG